MRRTVGGVVIALLIVGVMALRTQAQTAPPATSPKRLPLVIVTKTDGVAARGQLVSADADGVVIRTTAAAAPQTIGWADIKRVSNGLTRAQAIAAWKDEHKGELCDTCHGERTVPCQSCFGSGVDQSNLTPCAKCGGDGITAVCDAPKCNGTGKVDCPKPCLKLTQGTWRLRDGKRWRDFSVAGRGTYSISEHHLGELVDTKNGGTLGQCPTCRGTTKVECPTCDGMGVIVCDACDFAGVTGPACPKCKAGQVACATCKGSGLRSKT